MLAEGLTGRAAPLIVTSVLGGIVALALLLRRRPAAARVIAVVAVASVIIGWGAAQYPWLLVDQMTISEAAGAPATLRALLLVAALAGIIVIPLVYLFRLTQTEEWAHHQEQSSPRLLITSRRGAGHSARGSLSAITLSPDGEATYGTLTDTTRPVVVPPQRTCDSLLSILARAPRWDKPGPRGRLDRCSPHRTVSDTPTTERLRANREACTAQTAVSHAPTDCRTGVSDAVTGWPFGEALVAVRDRLQSWTHPGTISSRQAARPRGSGPE